MKYKKGYPWRAFSTEIGLQNPTGRNTPPSINYIISPEKENCNTFYKKNEYFLPKKMNKTPGEKKRRGAEVKNKY